MLRNKNVGRMEFGGKAGTGEMERLLTTTMEQVQSSQRPGQGTGLFVVESVMNFAMSPAMFSFGIIHTDSGKFPPKPVES